MKTEIEKRLANLRKQEQMLVANLNATKGAIAVLEDLLKPEEPGVVKSTTADQA